MRFLVLIVGLVAAVLLPFALWGEKLTALFSGDGAIEWVRGWGAWGSLAVIALLVADLFLPIPGTPLMSAAGYVYGMWVGGLLSSAGSFLSGLLAYGLCRQFGQKAALRLVGEVELARYQQLFARSGAWLVALSRWLPVLPEVIACLAGLLGMPFRTFVVALACGALPMGFAYAGIGAAGHTRPQVALILSALLPIALWVGVQWVQRRFAAPRDERPRA